MQAELLLSPGDLGRRQAAVVGLPAVIVELTGTASSPSLTFIESGLSGAEQSLGLASPFDVGGQPLVVPIRHVNTLPGC